MIKKSNPRVSIGIPVFNGEKYLKEALDSILAQTYQDFEIIVSDNASTDSTQQICLDYAAIDGRIKYFRNEKNIGAPKNFNRVFELSSGEYFKWAAYDDVHAPDYLHKCISVLDNDHSIVLCHCETGKIDEYGNLIGIYNENLLKRICSRKPHERFGDLTDLFYFCCLVFGVIRADYFKKTQLMGKYVGSDRNLLAEIGLIGRIYKIHEILFFERLHPDAYSANRPWPYTPETPIDDWLKEMLYWAGECWTSFPHWKNCVEYFRSVNRAPLKLLERFLCYNQIIRWIMKQGWFYMVSDLEFFLLRNSHFARIFIPFTFNCLSLRIKPIIKKFFPKKFY